MKEGVSKIVREARNRGIRLEKEELWWPFDKGVGVRGAREGCGAARLEKSGTEEEQGWEEAQVETRWVLTWHGQLWLKPGNQPLEDFK